VAFIAAHRERETGGLRWGVEPVCAALQVAPSTYYGACSRPSSARACRDAELGPELRELWERNYPVYGRRKLWKAARRAGIDVGRDQVARLMGVEGLRGATRAKKRRTTKPDPLAVRAPDLLRRDFTCACRKPAPTGQMLCGRRRPGHANGAWRAGLGSGWRAMIFGLWA
jgi:putative transposase